MTKIQFNKLLDKAYDNHPMLKMSKVKSLNELIYVLRMEFEDDFCINTLEADRTFSCIPSIKETFIPTRVLALKIKSREYDEETFEEMGQHLLMSETK